MDQPEPSGSGEPNTKGEKSNNENDQNASVEEALAVNQEQTADILKMDIDCCEEAFDYLPLEDLISVGKTCKRMQQVAGHCFQQQYSECVVQISKEGAYTQRANETKYYVQHFAPFIQKILINDEHGLRYFSKWQSKFLRLKQIQIKDFNITETDCLKKISMGKLEVLRLNNIDLCNNFHEIIDQCTKLKHLQIEGCKGELHWLNRKYPTLEQFTFYPRRENFIEGIPAFLELNPNIRKFETNAKFLWEQRDTMMAASVKLEDLYIIIMRDIDSSEFLSMCDLLVKLNKRGFYKKLKINCEIINQETVNRLASLNGFDKLLFFCDSTVSLSAMNNLEEIFVIGSNNIADIDKLPNALINLKRIHFILDSIDSIMPFIRCSVEMQTIEIGILRTGVHFNRDTGIIDLPALNRERALLSSKRLDGVQKLTLYVEKQIYLTTKWAIGETDFEYIKLKRNRF